MAERRPAAVIQLRVGQVVRSRAGRDRGRAFLVIAVLDVRHVLVADGRARRISDPKRKNVRHLDPEGTVAPALAQRLTAGSDVSDREVRCALAELLDPKEAGDAEAARQQDEG